MKLNCIIIDDEITARNILKKYIKDVPFLVLLNEYRNAVEALEYLDNSNVDVVFLDIEMPRLSGLKMAKLLDDSTQIIFTTAHREFAPEGFELSAIDYLLKPISFERFLQAAKRAHRAMGLSRVEKETPTHFFIKVDKKMIRVEFSQLYYIKGMGNYVKIYTATDTFVVYDTVKNIMASLRHGPFLRIHKSYIVNTDKIDLYTKEFVEINKKHISIGRSYRQGTLQFLSGGSPLFDE